jgi:RNA polymerase sigma factor (sigma-70 family)
MNTVNTMNINNESPVLLNHGAEQNLHSSHTILDQDIALAQSGNMAAYERLIQKSQNVVTTIALAIVKDVDESEEIAQQVFISIWQNLEKLQNPSSFLPWVRQTTRYTAFNYMRDNKKKHRVPSNEADLLLAQIADDAVELDQGLMKQDQSALLYRFIDELAEDEREIVLLYYREEQSSKQVAALLDVTEDNVRQKLSRVRKRLKVSLTNQMGHYILTSAPAVGFSSLVSSLLVPAPVAASTIFGATTSNASSSFLSKIAMILGGSLIGAFTAVLAIIWSSKLVIKKIPGQSKKLQFKKYRNETIAWVMAWGFIMMAAYELTHGWVGPVTAYACFGAGLIILMNRSIDFLQSAQNNSNQLTNKYSQIIGKCGLWIGVTTGLVSMLVGLINSGRLVFG